jgi:uncharacterized OB-fold protein
MTPDEQQSFEAEIHAFVGRQVCPRQPARDSVNQAMIRHWAEAMGDCNPAYLDPDWAGASRRGGLIAPPAMLYVWNQQGISVATEGRAPDPQSELVELFNKHGFTGVLGTDVRQEYFKEAAPGDTVYMEMVIDSVSEQKATARGVGYFFETLATFTDQRGETIGTQRFRVLKFVPAQQPAAAGAANVAKPTRIASPRGADNGWWWEACDEGRVLIQRCGDCGELRHPPRPMCGHCQSMSWDSVESGLAGEVLSFTQIHHPRVPGYQYPLVCAVIKLAEGTHLVANVVGCEPESVHIGMAVQGAVETLDEKIRLPQFYPAEIEHA